MSAELPPLPEEADIQLWLDGLCRATSGAVRGVVMTGGLAAEQVPAAVWPRGNNPSRALTRAAAVAAERRKPVWQKVRGSGDSGTMVSFFAYPLSARGQMLGVVALTVRHAPGADFKSLMRSLKAAAGSFEGMCQSRSAGAVHGPAELIDLVTEVLERPDVATAGREVARRLGESLECSRVVLALPGRRSPEWLACWPAADAPEKDASLVLNAMAEAMEQSAVVVHPEPVGADPLAMRAHLALADGRGSLGICTVPMLHQEQVLGAILLERPGGQPFLSAELSFLSQAAGLLGATLNLRRAAPAGKPARTARPALSWPRKPRLSPGLALAGAAAAVALAFLPVEYHIHAPARLEALPPRPVQAPGDGQLRLFAVQPGEMVKAGQILAEWSDPGVEQALQQQLDAVAKLQQAVGDATAKGDLEQVAALKGFLADAQAALEATHQRKGGLPLKSPVAGRIVPVAVTVPVERGVKKGETVISVVPQDAFRLEAEVSAGDMAELAADQAGVFVPAEAPAARVAVQIVKRSDARDDAQGLPVVPVEARLERPGPELRAGSEGVVSFPVGERPAAWVLLHRVRNWWRAIGAG